MPALSTPSRASETPVLWEGKVQNPDGGPADGVTVVAYARPAVDELERGAGLTEIVRTTTDASGRYILRAAPTPAVTDNADEAGWITVMVFALSKTGVALPLDSIAWQPASHGHPLR